MSNTSIAKFEAFEAYNFENDEQFQTGVKSLMNNKQGNEADLLERAKLFYYTKYKDSFSIEEYEAWKKNKSDELVITEKESKDQGDNDTDKPPRFSFQELVDMIEKGIEVPGIKQIPNVLNEGTPSQPKMTARPKPWELNNNNTSQQDTDTDVDNNQTNGKSAD